MHLIRSYSDIATMPLVAILDGQTSGVCVDANLSGMISGPPTWIVVPLVGDLIRFLDEYIVSTFREADQAKEFRESHQQWYGIVEGCHVHAAILVLRKKIPSKWYSVKWKVFYVRHGHTLEEYRQLAVVQNERNKHVYHFEPTLYEMLISIRRNYDNLHDKLSQESRTCSRGVNVLHRDVACQYDGGRH